MIYYKNFKGFAAIAAGIYLMIVLAGPSLAIKPVYLEGKIYKNIAAAENKKNWLGPDYYFYYQFNQRPTIGTNILKIQIFDKKDKKVNSFKLKGLVEMPAMGSAHNSGWQAFFVNKKNDYLLPIDLVMRGEWDINVVFYKGNSKYAPAKIKINI